MLALKHFNVLTLPFVCCVLWNIVNRLFCSRVNFSSWSTQPFFPVFFFFFHLWCRLFVSVMQIQSPCCISPGLTKALIGMLIKFCFTLHYYVFMLQLSQSVSHKDPRPDLSSLLYVAFYVDLFFFANFTLASMTARWRSVELLWLTPPVRARMCVCMCVWLLSWHRETN